MKFKFAVLFLLVTLFVAPALAQENTTHTVSFDGFSFSFDAALAQNVNIAQITGDPVETADPGFSDAAHTRFTLHSQQLHLGEMLEGIGGISIYRMADLAQYSFLQEQVEWLQQLLAEQPDLASVAANSQGANRLPFVPVLSHGQVIVAQAEYVQTDAVQGIRYIAANLAAAEPFMSNTFGYTFQGISADGQYYVTAGFRLNTDLFPAEAEPVDPETFSSQFEEYLVESIATLNEAEPATFQPALTMLDMTVESFRFED